MLAPGRAVAQRAARGGTRPRLAQRLHHQLVHGGVTISWTPAHMVVRHGGEKAAQSVLDAAALRDSCTCRACKDASSGQKSFASVEIPPEIAIAAVRPTEDGLAIAFANDMARFADRAHETVLPWPRVQQPDSLSRRTQAILGRTGVQYWDAGILARQVRKIDYEAFLQRDSPSFWDAVVDLLRLGIVFLANVPRRESSVETIATRIANIRETFYGRTFDVRAKPRAENVAYTTARLGLHQDLCYLSPPPMIQVLHCLDNSCSGGESLFSDGQRAARLLWPLVAASPKMAPLADHPIPYQYDRHGYFYRTERTVLQRDEHGRLAVFWSPPFQGGYGSSSSSSADLKAWIPAARIFNALINHPLAVHEYKMEEGECVLFDNLRVLHGRNAFDAARGGTRWLRGAYISEEDFLSKAAYIPGGRADVYARGGGWTVEAAERELRGGEWYADVVRRVREIDPGIGGEGCGVLKC